ncbi:MAG: DUF2288 family protein [Myxococcota bacterium]|nr:DUF2288 family protein [Myxococcota bacterium]
MNDIQTEIKDKLSKEIGTAPWSLLEIHAHNDHLILVAAHIDLVEAAVAVVTNDAARVSRWIEEKSLDKPKLTDWKTFQNTPGLRFHFVIAHPFVLAKEIDISNGH